MNGWPFTSLITSRGCPYNCYFCSSSKFGGLKWRARNAKSIVDEIEHLINTYGYKAFSFMDDNFTLDPQRIFQFAEELENRGINDIHWWCFSRVDTLVKNEEMVRRMAESGAYMIFLGLESNSPETLKSYNKRIEVDQQQKAIDLLRKYRIEVHGSYILGNIIETREMAENTIKWAKSLRVKSNQFSLLTPYPGTALYEKTKKENRLLHMNWELYNGLFPVIKLDYLTPRQEGNLLIKAYLKVYLIPPSIFSPRTGSGNNHFLRSLPAKIKSTIRIVSLLVKLTTKMRMIRTQKMVTKAI
jgi:anaerobic magnesium-protoporphyrin IX monomethyl ester cyclase